jgi:hypothetical protein
MNRSGLTLADNQANWVQNCLKMGEQGKSTIFITIYPRVQILYTWKAQITDYRWEFVSKEGQSWERAIF